MNNHLQLVDRTTYTTVQVLPTQVIDKQALPNNDAGMSPLTREELDAKLDARDARADARMARFEERIDLSLKQLETTTAAFRQDIRDMRTELRSELHATKVDLEQKIDKQRVSIWAAAATVIATVLTGYALMFQAFDTGRETAKLNAEAGQQAAESLKRSTELIERLEAMSSSKAKDAQAGQKP